MSIRVDLGTRVGGKAELAAIRLLDVILEVVFLHETLIWRGNLSGRLAFTWGRNGVFCLRGIDCRQGSQQAK